MSPDQPADVPVSPELAEVRDVVRRLEARTACEHGVDTPAYWRAMSDHLQQHLAGTRFAPTPRQDTAGQDRTAERAYGWLVRVAAAYRALAEPGIRS